MQHLCPHFSRNSINYYLRQGAIRLNNRLARKGMRLKPGDEVDLPLVDQELSANFNIPVKVVLEDEHLLVIDKPANIPCHPIYPHQRNTVVNGLKALYPQLASIGNQPLCPALVHRLDNCTSGLLMAAKTEVAHSHLRDMFSNNQIEKEYLTLARGLVKEEDEGELETFLGPAPRKREQVISYRDRLPSQRGFRLARTFFHIKQLYRAYTLLQVKLATGCRHQIRVHLAQELGTPVVGDPLYDPEVGKEKLDRIFLHAHSLRFQHPNSGQPVEIKSSLPAQLQTFLETLTPI